MVLLNVQHEQRRFVKSRKTKEMPHQRGERKLADVIIGMLSIETHMNPLVTNISIPDIFGRAILRLDCE